MSEKKDSGPSMNADTPSEKRVIRDGGVVFSSNAMTESLSGSLSNGLELATRVSLESVARRRRVENCGHVELVFRLGTISSESVGSG